MTPEEKALAITSSFEGMGGFANLSPNFDDMGISFGVLQWNFGMGSLQTLLKSFYNNGPKTFKAYCKVGSVDYFDELIAAMGMPPKKAVEWAKTIQTLKNGKWTIDPEWVIIFKRFGTNKVFCNLQVRAAQYYLDKAREDMKWSGVYTERSFALFLDISVQNGGLRAAHKLLVNKNKKGKALLEDVARAVASCANKKWQKDVLSRKMTIVSGFGYVHGKYYDLEKVFGLTDREMK